jgi:hypothetical protein
MVVQAVAVVLRSGAQAVGNTARVTGQATARGAAYAGRSLSRVGARAAQGAGRRASSAGRTAGSSARHGYNNRPKVPKKHGARPPNRTHDGPVKPRGRGQRKHANHPANGQVRQPHPSKQPKQQPKQAKAEQPKKAPLKKDAKGLRGKLEELKPNLKARGKRMLRRQGLKQLGKQLRGKDKDDKNDPEKKARGKLGRAASKGKEFAQKRVRRLFTTKEGDKLRQKTKKMRRRVIKILALLTVVTVLIAFSPFIFLWMMLQGTPSPEMLQQVIAAQQAALLGGGGPIPAGMIQAVSTATGIPVEPLKAYSAAAGNPDWAIDWTILAGIGKVECDHGRDPASHCSQKWDVWEQSECYTTTDGKVCGAGERGPMQHLGHLWRVGLNNPNEPHIEGPPTPKNKDSDHVASDGDGDGIADPWDWDDAVLSTARKLTLYRQELKAKGSAYDTDEFMIASYNAGVSGSTRNGPNPRSIPNRSYVDKARAESSRIKTATAALAIPAIGGNAACPPDTKATGAQPIADTMITTAMRTVANSAINCFGRGKGIGCYDDRTWNGGKFEHPRGRACDFMQSSGMPNVVQTATGTALAEWAMANAKNLNIMYVIWYGKVWHVSRDKVIPWSQWRTYTGGSGVTGGHYDHVHISVKLMPGDPAYAHCVAGISCSE